MEPSGAAIAFLITVACVSAAVVPNKDENMINWCPSIWNSTEYNIIVLGHVWPPVSGCVVKKADQFNLRLMNPQGGYGGHCLYKDDSDMVSTHMVYDCVTSWKVPSVNGNSIPSRNLSFTLIRNQSAAKRGIQSYQCALIESVTTDGTKLLMAISADEHCDGLADRLLKPDYYHTKDETMVMLLYQNAQRPPQTMDRPKRKSTKYSDFAQGEWLNLRVEGGNPQNMHVTYHNEIDNGEEKGDDETGQQTRVRRHIYSEVTKIPEIKEPQLPSGKPQQKSKTKIHKRSISSDIIDEADLKTLYDPPMPQTEIPYFPNQKITNDKVTKIPEIKEPQLPSGKPQQKSKTKIHKRSISSDIIDEADLKTLYDPPMPQTEIPYFPNQKITNDKIRNIGPSGKQHYRLRDSHTVKTTKIERNKRSAQMYFPFMSLEAALWTLDGGPPKPTTDHNKTIFEQITKIPEIKDLQLPSGQPQQKSKTKIQKRSISSDIIDESDLKTLYDPPMPQTEIPYFPNQKITNDKIRNIGPSGKQHYRLRDSHTVKTTKIERNKRSAQMYFPFMSLEAALWTLDGGPPKPTTDHNKTIFEQITKIPEIKDLQLPSGQPQQKSKTKIQKRSISSDIIDESDLKTLYDPPMPQTEIPYFPNQKITNDKIRNIGPSGKQHYRLRDSHTVKTTKIERNKRSAQMYFPFMFLVPSLEVALWTLNGGPPKPTTDHNKTIFEQITKIPEIKDLQLPSDQPQQKIKTKIQKRSISSDIIDESDLKTLYDPPMPQTEIPYFPNQKLTNDKMRNIGPSEQTLLTTGFTYR